MYDHIGNNEEFESLDFNFEGYNYEVWNTGKLIKKGKCNIRFVGKKKLNDDGNKTIVESNDNLNNIIKNENIFDRAIASGDRYLLITLPENSNNNLIQSLTVIHGETRPEYELENNEAFSCSIFLINNEIAKLSFNLYGGNLLEVYNSI